MTARTLVRGAADRAETFNVHVDSVAGNDTTGTGTKAAPYATVAKALAVATAGQGIGLKRGSTFRPGSSLTTAAGSIRIGAYGAGAKPILSGGTVVTGWTRQSVVGASTVTNGGMETWAAGVPTGWTTTDPALSQSGAGAHTGSYAARLHGGYTLTQTAIPVTGGTSPTLAFWYRPDNAASAATYSLQIVGGAQAGRYLQADGTWAAAAASTNLTGAANTYYQISRTFAVPSDATGVTLVFGENAGTFTTWFDDVSLGTSSLTSTYAAPLAAAPGGTPGMVVAGAQALTHGSSATTLTANQWFWSGGSLYVNLGGSDPSGVTVEVATTVNVLSFTTPAQAVTLRNLDVRFGVNAGIYLSGIGRFVVDACAFKWGVYSSNSGYLLVQNCTGGGRIVRSTSDQLFNDAIWMHNSPHVEVAYNTMTNIGWLSGDAQSDGIQVEDTFGTNPNSTGVWIHHNTIIMTSTFSPKGCILVNGDTSVGAFGSAVVEHNTCVGGNYGVAAHAPNLTVRYNTCSGQVSTYGGNIHVDTAYVLDGMRIYRNLLLNSGRDGIVFQDGANNRTNTVIANNTIINPARAAMYLGSPISGSVVNNIIWWTTQPTVRALYVLSVAAGGTLVSDYNDLGPAFANYLRDGSNQYSTLAAWTAATGRDTHSISSDPLLSTDGLYLPQPGSPARNAGAVVVGITDGYLGTAPDLGYVEAALVGALNTLYPSASLYPDLTLYPQGA